jgi:hypothetical protein
MQRLNNRQQKAGDRKPAAFRFKAENFLTFI